MSRQKWLGAARCVSGTMPAELVTARVAKGVVQHSEEKAGNKKVQNISQVQPQKYVELLSQRGYTVIV